MLTKNNILNDLNEPFMKQSTARTHTLVTLRMMFYGIYRLMSCVNRQAAIGIALLQTQYAYVQRHLFHGFPHWHKTLRTISQCSDNDIHISCSEQGCSAGIFLTRTYSWELSDRAWCSLWRRLQEKITLKSCEMRRVVMAASINSKSRVSGRSGLVAYCTMLLPFEIYHVGWTHAWSALSMLTVRKFKFQSPYKPVVCMVGYKPWSVTNLHFARRSMQPRKFMQAQLPWLYCRCQDRPSLQCPFRLKTLS